MSGFITRRSIDPGLTEHERDVLVRLEKTGWFVNKVAGDVDGPGFAYSFGLYERFEHPEVIIFGLAPETMHIVINDIGKQLQHGMRYADGDQSHDLLEGYICQFGLVDRRWYKMTLTWAGWFYRSVDFPALQLFWPDKSGLFPWVPGCNERVRVMQPDLRTPSTQR